MSRTFLLALLSSGCMLSPGDDVVQLTSQDQTWTFSGYTLDPNQTVKVRCQSPHLISGNDLAQTQSSSSGFMYGGSMIYAWSTPATVTELCWEPATPGFSHALVYALEEQAWNTYEHFRIPELGCVTAAVGGGTSLVEAVPSCAADSNRSRFVVANSIPVDADPLEGLGAATLLDSGFSDIGGLVFDNYLDRVVFTDLATDTEYWHAYGTTSVAFEDMGVVAGLDFVPGHFFARTTHGSRRVEAGLSVTRTNIASAYLAWQFNTPHQLAGRVADQSIFFTDPAIGGPGPGGLDIKALYRIEESGNVALVAGYDDRQPWDLAFSPHEDSLYVTDPEQGEVLRFPIAPDHSVGTPAVFATVAGAKGLEVDVNGNVYVGGAAGIDVFDPGGTAWGTTTDVANVVDLAFGGQDRLTLFIADATSVSSIALPIPGTMNALAD